MEHVKHTVIASVDEERNISIRLYEKRDLEYIISRHRQLYGDEYGFGPEFGDYVEKYVLQFDNCHDENKENIWIAESGGKPIGVIAIVWIDDSTAQLRWFLVEPMMRGRGVGHLLMEAAIVFCRDKKYKHVFLWTVSNLHSARHLYGKYGFVLTEVKENNTWAHNLTEERWDLHIV